jgi:hypothetical protein
MQLHQTLFQLTTNDDWYASTDDWKEERWSGGPIRPFVWPLLSQAGGLPGRKTASWP